MKDSSKISPGNYTTGDGSYITKNAPKREFYLLKILQITP